MGKPSRWFNKLLRRCTRRKTIPTDDKSPPISTGAAAANANAGYSDTTSYGGDSSIIDAIDSNKHAIAVAAATAAVAEAALAAAKAAAEVVRLTSNAPPSSRHFSSWRWSSLDDLAAVKIQSAFRGYLARRALKALKGLVKLQALVRGHFVRKQSADMLRRLQAMVRVQARARSNRVINIESSNSSPSLDNPGSNELYAVSDKLENSPVLKRCGSNSSIRDSNKGSEKAAPATNWLDNWVEVGSSINNSSNLAKNTRSDDEKNDKILEVDSWKPPSKAARSRNPNFQPLRHISANDYYNHSFAASDYLARYSPNDLQKPIAEDSASLKSLHFPLETFTAEISSPQTYSGASRTGSMRRSPKTPSRDECSRSYLNGYATFASPSYMANTQSSRAKSRSQSVPRQRGDDSEKIGSVKRSLQAFWESKTSSKRSLELYSNVS